MRLAHLSYSNEGPFIHLVEIPWWAVLAEWAGDNIAYYLRLTDPPEWTYQIRWGKFEEFDVNSKGKTIGWTSRSLGSKLFGLGQWTVSGFGLWRREKSIARLPVTEDWVREHYPSEEWLFSDEMRQSPEDKGDITL